MNLIFSLSDCKFLNNSCEHLSASLTCKMTSVMTQSGALAKTDGQKFRMQASPLAQRSLRVPAPFVSSRQKRKLPTRRQQIIRAGLLDFLTPQAGPKTDARADELVSELLEIAAKTNGGAKASSSIREQLDDLVRSESLACRQISPDLWTI